MHEKSSVSRIGWVLVAIGAPAAVVAAALDPADARSAAAQDWSAFVLVAGLLLVGLVADDEGLFEATGNRLAHVGGEATLYAGATVVVAGVTALLNLDTSVAFLTPVMVHLARARRINPAPLLYSCLLVSNAGSLLLPGSNLTNLIVLGHLHLSGGRFAATMAPAFAASVVVTSSIVAFVHRRDLMIPAGSSLRRVPDAEHTISNAVVGAPLLAIGALLATTVVVLTLRSPAIFVAVIGVAAVAVRLLQRRERVAHVLSVLGAQILAGLFGVAVALGTLGRSWSGPSRLLAHLDSWATAVLAAVTSVVVNNLPAASLLAARVPPHPYSLLVGLNLGPNLFVTGSLSSLLWLNGARNAGENPSVRHVAALGVVVVPISMAVALGALAATGRH